jgi:hypothetical protein
MCQIQNLHNKVSKVISIHSIFKSVTVEVLCCAVTVSHYVSQAEADRSSVSYNIKIAFVEDEQIPVDEFSTNFQKEPSNVHFSVINTTKRSYRRFFHNSGSLSYKLEAIN